MPKAKRGSGGLGGMLSGMASKASSALDAALESDVGGKLAVAAQKMGSIAQKAAKNFKKRSAVQSELDALLNGVAETSDVNMEKLFLEAFTAMLNGGKLAPIEAQLKAVAEETIALLTTATEKAREKYTCDPERWALMARAVSKTRVETNAQPYSSPRIQQECVDSKLRAAKQWKKAKAKVDAMNTMKKGAKKPKGKKAAGGKKKIQRQSSTGSIAETELERAEMMYIKELIARGNFSEKFVTGRMVALEVLFNGARHAMDLSLEPADWPLGLHPENYVLKYKGTHYMKKNCFMKSGGVKSETRSFEKVRNDYIYDDDQDTVPAARRLLDVLRYTFSFEDPYALGMFYALLDSQPWLDIVRTKPKLVDESISAELATAVLINLQVTDVVGKPLIFEIQLMLNDFLIIKDSQHKYYEVERAGSVEEVLSTPIFQRKLAEAVAIPQPAIADLEAYRTSVAASADGADADAQSALQRLDARIAKKKSGGGGGGDAEEDLVGEIVGVAEEFGGFDESAVARAVSGVSAAFGGFEE